MKPQNDISQNNIKVLVVEPDKCPYTKDIENELHTLQQIVGGYIEAVYPFEDPVAVICSEEGKLIGMPLNRSLRDSEGNIYDIIAGTFLVVGLTEDDFGSLSPDQIHKFTSHFKTPEAFMRINGRIVSVPVPPKDRSAADEKDPLLSKIQSATLQAEKSKSDPNVKGKDTEHNL